jgi:prevent-host-death family protein
MTYEIPVTQARAEFADLVNRVSYGGERIVVTRHGKPIVALVTADDLAKLEQLDREPGTVIKLGGGGVVSQPGATAQPSRSSYDVAARHSPPGG